MHLLTYYATRQNSHSIYVSSMNGIEKKTTYTRVATTLDEGWGQMYIIIGALVCAHCDDNWSKKNVTETVALQKQNSTY